MWEKSEKKWDMIEKVSKCEQKWEIWGKVWELWKNRYKWGKVRDVWKFWGNLRNVIKRQKSVKNCEDKREVW